MVADVDERTNAETAHLIQEADGQAVAVRCDVTRALDIQAALACIGRHLRWAGLCPQQRRGRAAQRASGRHHRGGLGRVMAVSLRGVFLSMKHKIPLLLQRGGGAIVNTSSGAGVKGFAGGAAYGAAKFGIIGATKCAALDYASSGIRINAVCPGIIDTHMIERVFGGTPEGRQAVLDQEPIGRMGQPDEIAAAVLWLCSEEASFAVGHATVVDGGQIT